MIFKYRDLYLGAAFSFLAVLCLYHKVLTESLLAINQTDAVNLVLTRSFSLIDALRSGHAPLWNAYANLGQATADGSGYAYSIATLLFLFLDPSTAHHIFLLACLFGLFFCSWLYLRHLGFTVFSSLAGCVVYALSGPVFFHHSYIYDIPVLVCLPLTLYLFSLWDHGGSKKFLIAAAIVLSITMLSSNPHMMLYAMGLLAINRFVMMPKQKFMMLLLLWALFLAAVFMIGGVYLLSLAEWTTSSAREAMSYGGTFFPSPVNLVYTALLGIYKSIHNIYDVYKPYYFFIGWFPFLLMLVGLWKAPKDRLKTFFLWSLLLPAQYFIFYGFYFFGKGLMENMDHWRAMIPFMLPFAIMSAKGIDYLLNKIHSYAMPLVIKLMMAFILFMPLAHHFFYALRHVNKEGYSQRQFIVDTTNYWKKVGASMDHESGKGRVAGYHPFINTAMLAGNRVLPSYTNVLNGALESELSSLNLLARGHTSGIMYLWTHLGAPDGRMLAMYGIQYLLLTEMDKSKMTAAYRPMWTLRKDLSARSGPFIYENNYFRGRAYVISRNGQLYPSGKVKVTDVSQNHIVCQVTSTQSGDRLVLADQAFVGWKVFINGKEASWRPHRQCLRMVELSGNAERVEWIYAPHSFPAGLGLSAAGIVLLIFSLFALINHRKKHSSK